MRGIYRHYPSSFFDMSLQHRRCCPTSQQKPRCPETLGPLPFVGAAAVKWRRPVSWYSVPRAWLFLLFVSSPPTYCSFASPNTGSVAFHPLGVKLSSEALLPSWPMHSRKAQGQTVSLQWVCSPSRCHLWLEPMQAHVPEIWYMCYLPIQKNIRFTPGQPLRVYKVRSCIPHIWSLHPLQKVSILILCTNQGQCQTGVFRSLPKPQCAGAEARPWHLSLDQMPDSCSHQASFSCCHCPEGQSEFPKVTKTVRGNAWAQAKSPNTGLTSTGKLECCWRETQPKSSACLCCSPRPHTEPCSGPLDLQTLTLYLMLQFPICREGKLWEWIGVTYMKWLVQGLGTSSFSVHGPLLSSPWLALDSHKALPCYERMLGLCH